MSSQCVAGQLRVLIVDDHLAVAEALALAFREGHEVNVIGVNEDIPDWLQTHEVDLLLLDSTLPHCDLYALIRTIHHQHPPVVIVVVSMYPGNAEWPGIHRVGARGVVSKALPLAEFVRTVQELANRPSGLHAELADPAPHASPRQLDYVIATARGGGRKQVAEELGIHNARVDELGAEVRHTLRALSGPHMVLRAVEEAWIEPRVPPPATRTPELPPMRLSHRVPPSYPRIK